MTNLGRADPESNIFQQQLTLSGWMCYDEETCSLTPADSLVM